MDDILEKFALEQSQLVRSGKISAVELTKLYLDRIATHNPKLTAFVEVFRREAVREARQRDGERRRGRIDPNSPLWGVPVAIKDLDLVRNSFTRFGSRAFRYLWSPVDGPCAKRLRRGGMVIVGKTSTSELGAMPVTEPDIHPPTRNPWNLEHSSGGSSGGSGSAVAARLVPIAHGSDGAGSVRIPAAFCGLFGYKASRGKLVNPYAAQDKLEMSTVGPLARSVVDMAALADVFAADRRQSPLQIACERAPTNLKIHVIEDSPIGNVDPEVRAALRRMAAGLIALGHDVDVGVAMAGSVDEFLPIYQRQFASAPVLSDRMLQPVTRWLRRAGKKIPAAMAIARMRQLRDRAEAAWGDADIWLTPTVSSTAPKVGAYDGLAPAQAFAQAAPIGAFTAIFNLTGQPAVTLPVGLGACGLPIGVQLIGRINEDAKLLALARALELAMPLRAVPPAAMLLRND